MTSKIKRVLYRCEQYPVFQNRTYRTREAARSCPRGDILLVEDQVTGLVSNARFDPLLLEYDQDYQNEQAVSAAFRDHLERVSSIIEASLGKSGLVEVGCGKAFFLEMLQRKGFEIHGFDPAYEGDNPSVLRQAFSADCPMNADGLILRHVLEHVQDPVGFLESLLRANGGRGTIYIEVPCFDWICRRRAWFDVFYEHVNYFRLDDFRRMFGRVIEAGRVFGEQYIYVIADLASLRTPRFDNHAQVNFPAEFGLSPESIRELSGEDGLCVWGGASKGVIFALVAERLGAPVSSVVDINPAKQGSYLAGTGHLIQSPSWAVDSLSDGMRVLVMNQNYLEEVRDMTRDRFDYVSLDRKYFA